MFGKVVAGHRMLGWLQQPYRHQRVPVDSLIRAYSQTSTPFSSLLPLGAATPDVGLEGRSGEPSRALCERPTEGVVCHWSTRVLLVSPSDLRLDTWSTPAPGYGRAARGPGVPLPPLVTAVVGTAPRLWRAERRHRQGHPGQSPPPLRLHSARRAYTLGDHLLGSPRSDTDPACTQRTKGMMHTRPPCRNRPPLLQAEQECMPWLRQAAVPIPARLALLLWPSGPLFSSCRACGLALGRWRSRA